MKQFKIAISLIGVCILLCACPSKSGHPYITVLNSSDKNITCQVLWAGNITEADTLYQCHLLSIDIGVDSSYCYESSSVYGGWESDFETIPYLQILILDGESYNRYMTTPCDTIRKYVPILHRYHLKLEDLERMNWTVVYPPEKE